MNDSHVRRFASSLVRSSPRGATDMAYMLLAGSFISQALAMTGNLIEVVDLCVNIPGDGLVAANVPHSLTIFAPKDLSESCM